MILVFGKTGQVAQELQTLEGIITLDRYQANLRNPKLCAELIFHHSPTAVINAAAYTAVDKAENDVDTAMKVNAEAPSAMSKACARLNIPFVHISTDFVFEGTGNTPWQPLDFAKPINIYGRSKLKGEQAIVASGATFVILRTSWVISAHGNNFVKTMLRLSEKLDKLQVVVDQIGGPTPAREIAKACVDIANQLIFCPQKKGIYHFSGIPDISWFDFANEIFKAISLDITVVPIPTSEYYTEASRPLNSRLDCSKTVEQFNLNRPFWRHELENILKILRK